MAQSTFRAALQSIIEANQQDIVRPFMSRFVRGVATAAMTAQLAAAPLALNGCAISTDPPGECMSADQSLEDVRVQLGVDYFAFYSRFDAFIGPPTWQVDAAGTPCSEGTCEAELAAFVSERNAEDMMPSTVTQGRFIVTTDGEGFHMYTSVGEALGQVDSIAKATLVLRSSGYWMSCDQDSLRAINGGYEAIRYTMTCDDSNQWREQRQVVRVTAAAEVELVDVELGAVESDSCPVAGRRPVGLQSAPRQDVTAVADFFARMAHLEGAAVIAFESMVEELEFHQAPSDLVAAAREAVADEVRHHQQMSQLAMRFGASIPEVHAEPFAPRSMFDIALDNAVEGCVRETYGAIVASFQGMRSTDPAVAAVMREVAEDETRHAELSWQLAAWAEARLTETERQRIRAAQRIALEELRQNCQGSVARELQNLAGLPGPVATDELLRQLDDALDLH